jgi:hypothetical protein
MLSATLLSQGAPADGIVRASGVQLTCEGRPYRAIGVNVPHLSQAYMGTWHHWQSIYGSREAMRAAIEEAVADAARHQVAFIRFFASPGYPKGTAELYGQDRESYWQQMDELFTLCRQHRVKLVPSLGTVFKWHLDCGEPRTAVLDPQSRTYAATYGYVREIVTRYRDDPTVLMWELENEAFLAADVDQRDRPAPGRGIYPADSHAYRAAYAHEDSLRFEMLLQHYRNVTALIKKLDPHHLVTSGDAGVREESMSRRETFPDFQWRTDSLREHLSNLLQSQPAPLDVMSLHAYGNFSHRGNVAGLSALAMLAAQVRAIHAAGRPVFIGELGQIDPNLREDPAGTWTRAALDLLDEEGVAVAALWVWHFPWHNQHHNIADGARHPQLLQRVAEFNRVHAQLDP